MARRAKSSKPGSKRSLNLTLKLALSGIAMTLTTLGILASYREGENAVETLSIATLEQRERTARPFLQLDNLNSSDTATNSLNSTAVFAEPKKLSLSDSVIVDATLDDTSTDTQVAMETSQSGEQREDKLQRNRIKLHSRSDIEARSKAFETLASKATEKASSGGTVGRPPLDFPAEHRPVVPVSKSEHAAPAMKIADSALTGWYLDPAKIEVLSTDKLRASIYHAL